MDTVHEGDGLRVMRSNTVAHIVLDMPPVNALGPGIWVELDKYMDELAKTDDVSVLILSGAGRGFTAGADLRVMGDLSESDREMHHRVQDGVLAKLYEFPAATICAIHGFVIGAGLSLSGLCDIRVAAENSIFSMPEIDWGISVGGGGAYLSRVGVRAGRVREMMLTGRRVLAEEASTIGLVDYVVPASELRVEVDRLVATLSEKDVRSIRLMKAGLNAAERSFGWELGVSTTTRLSSAMRSQMDPAQRMSKFFD